MCVYKNKHILPDHTRPVIILPAGIIKYSTVIHKHISFQYFVIFFFIFSSLIYSDVFCSFILIFFFLILANMKIKVK